MADPLVSILTPSFNQARWLEDNLRSVQAQTYPNIEHVVMDGGSTDRSVEILQHWDGSALKWRSEPDAGQSDALNKALAWSNGDIVGWLNSDDALADRRTIEWIVATFERFADVDVVYGHVLDTDENGRVVRLNWSPPPWAARLDRDLNPATQPGAFFRRRAIADEFVRTDLHFAMDHELFLRLLRSGHRFRRVRRVLATNRHQLERKSLVRPPRSVEEYAVVRGPETRLRNIRRRTASRLVSTTCRVIGAWPFLGLGRSLAPASLTTLPPPSTRLRLQLMTRTEAYLLAQGAEKRR